MQIFENKFTLFLGIYVYICAFIALGKLINLKCLSRLKIYNNFVQLYSSCLRKIRVIGILCILYTPTG